MDTRDPLFRHTATAENGAGLRAERIGGLVVLTPLTAEATAWLHQYANAEASWLGEALAVESRYFPWLADAAIAAGLSFERDPMPN